MSEIQSILRAFDILRVVSSCPDGIGLSDISARVSLPKSTVSRMLSTLESVGAVERVNGASNAREGFCIGAELVALASQVAYPRSLVAVARPHLQELSQFTGETVTLCVPEGDFAHYIDQIDSRRALQVKDWTGERLPLHACSDGKVYLASRSDEHIENFLKQPMQRFTRNTLATPRALWKELRAIRTQGYAWTNGEYDADLAGVAAPIRDIDNHVVASVCLFGPAFRLPPEEQATELIHLTMETAGKISARLRNSSPTRNGTT